MNLLNPCIALCALLLSLPALAGEAKAHALPESQQGNLVVGLCDGKTSVEVKGVRPGQPLSRTQAQQVSDQLMEQWKRKNPDARWDPPAVATSPSAGSMPAPTPVPGSSTSTAGDTASSGAKQVPRQKGQAVQSGHTYGAFSERDEAIWRASTQQFVDRGRAVFHDAKELGGTIAVSCDMCHPDAANTHPETYPKYQVQLGRVALLRDMINWCIENPVRGRPLPDDDERLRAMEAYIYAQRKGTPLEFGKH